MMRKTLIFSLYLDLVFHSLMIISKKYICIQALFWSAHQRISAHFPRIPDPSEISTNLLR